MKYSRVGSAKTVDAARDVYSERDYDRLEMRCSAFDLYSLVSALMVGIAYDGLSKLMDDAYREEKSSKSIIDPFLFFFLLMTVFCAFYSMVIFTLISLYSRTAAGVGREKYIADYLRSTYQSRKYSFVAFQWSILFFFVYIAALPLSYFILPNLENEKNTIRIFGSIIFVSTIPVYVISYIEIKKVIEYARPIFENADLKEGKRQRNCKKSSGKNQMDLQDLIETDEEHFMDLSQTELNTEDKRKDEGQKTPRVSSRQSARGHSKRKLNSKGKSE